MSGLNAIISHLHVEVAVCEAVSVDSATGVASAIGVKVLYATMCETTVVTELGLAAADTLAD